MTTGSTISIARGPVTFECLNPYKLTGVNLTKKVLGRGSYATVLEVEYMKVKCAGKKIHEILTNEENSSVVLLNNNSNHVVTRFEQECEILSMIRHPNIVQFLGVYFEKDAKPHIPILVMEHLPMNLTTCIRQYGIPPPVNTQAAAEHEILPMEVSYSILHDVALGLHYLHSQSPPIIHRDLSSNNVLLTPNMTAKISDLGVARILDLTPLQIKTLKLLQAPGTLAFMPPEVMVAKPKYDTSVDIFSYGNLMIHVFSGRWPEPQVGPNRTEPGGRLIPVTEAERREVFLRTIGSNHPLMDLICKCIENDPGRRSHTVEIVDRLAVQVEQDMSFDDRLKMLRCIQGQRQEIKVFRGELESRVQEVKQGENQIRDLTKKIKGLELAHSISAEQLKLQIRHEHGEKMQSQHERDAAKDCILQLESKMKRLESYNFSIPNQLERAAEYLKSNKVSC
jgi:serine/threonine protein kinase